MKKPITPEGAKLRMADLCSRSEQCASDVSGKLLRFGLSAAQTKEIIESLKRDKFIDESRFAGAYARDKVRFAGWGVNKIRMGLIAKRISQSDIQAALASIDRSEYIEGLKRVGLAKAKGLNLNKPGDAAKFMRHILSRGYEASLASKLLEALRKRQNG